MRRLKEFREAQALSQRDLASASGVAQATISLLEQGDRKVRPSTLRKLAKALGVEPPALLGDKGTTEEATAPSHVKSPAASARWTEISPTSSGTVRFRFGDDTELEFGSFVEAYAAGYCSEGMVFSGMARTMITSVDPNDVLKLPLSKLESDQPEEIEEAATMALFVARNIAEGMEKQDDLEPIIRDYQDVPYHYWERPDSAARLADLGWSLATLRHEYQQEAAITIRKLLDVHDEALQKLENISSPPRTGESYAIVEIYESESHRKEGGEP